LTPWSSAADSLGPSSRNSPPAETPDSIFEFSPTCSQSSISIRTPSSRATACNTSRSSRCECGSLIGGPNYSSSQVRTARKVQLSRLARSQYVTVARASRTRTADLGGYWARSLDVRRGTEQADLAIGDTAPLTSHAVASATSWRSTTNSVSFEAEERASNASQPARRMNINTACAPSQTDDVASRTAVAADKIAGQSLTARFETPQGTPPAYR